jgi:outer membrane receptor protein involved in Fe transport
LRTSFISYLFILFFSALTYQAIGQGVLAGNILNEGRKPLETATIELISMTDSMKSKSTVTSKDGEFAFANISFGLYRLRISYVGLQTLTIDSLHFRTERFDFNFSDIILKPGTSEKLDEIIVYAEKPLIQSKDGNITFNAGESALSAGSNASDLLISVPLVAKDASGKITVRGKEPKILIDDKPVELNLQQLQELLESMPGSSVDKIEVMTNPPPQYANEQGGVINIVTKKGRVGKSGRINISSGRRGEVSVSGAYNYRKQNFGLSINGGIGYSRLPGNGNSIRNNFYADSSNSFKTTNDFLNKSLRPNFRMNLDYDLNKTEAINLVLSYNQSSYQNQNVTEYTNINRFGDIYRLSERTILNEGDSYTPGGSFSYSKKGKQLGELFKVLVSVNNSVSTSDRGFYQQFFNNDHTPNGIDSTQQQINENKNNNHTLRVDYNKPLKGYKTFFSIGTYYSRSNSYVLTDASYLKKPENVFEKSLVLSNNFRFHQTIVNGRFSVRQVLKPNFSITAGVSAEQIWFELYKENREAKNNYITLLPFANINRTWKDKLNLTIAYRRSIRRPGINELNPTVDFGDPYNVRFGNENLEASTAHNFDLIIGRTKIKYFINLGLGYNIVENIFSQVRTLLTDGKTQITWENISGRKEYEVSSWGGLTISKKVRANVSASYTYNEYSLFDKIKNRYRNGGSFTTNINGVYTPKDVWSFTGSFSINRFANPQGYARWNWSMNAGIQKRFFAKRLTVTLNVIDPFSQQNRNFTYGSNFTLQSFSNTQTRNIRISAGYNFVKPPKKKPATSIKK